MGLLMSRIAVKQGYLWVLQFSTVSVIPLMLPTHILFICHRQIDSVITWNTLSFDIHVQPMITCIPVPCWCIKVRFLSFLSVKWSTSNVQCFKRCMRLSSVKNQGGKENVYKVGPVKSNLCSWILFVSFNIHAYLHVCVCNSCQMFMLCIYLSVFSFILWNSSTSVLLLIFGYFSVFMITSTYGCQHFVELCNV
jgi:hypothetical protein